MYHLTLYLPTNKNNYYYYDFSAAFKHPLEKSN